MKNVEIWKGKRGVGSGKVEGREEGERREENRVYEVMGLWTFCPRRFTLGFVRWGRWDRWKNVSKGGCIVWGGEEWGEGIDNAGMGNGKREAGSGDSMGG